MSLVASIVHHTNSTFCRTGWRGEPYQLFDSFSASLHHVGVVLEAKRVETTEEAKLALAQFNKKKVGETTMGGDDQ